MDKFEKLLKESLELSKSKEITKEIEDQIRKNFNKRQKIWKEIEKNADFDENQNGN